jgi:hypothetical protein
VKQLVYKDSFLNSLDGAGDEEIVAFAEQLEQTFPNRPEILDPIHTAKKLPQVQQRVFVLRRAIECSLNNLLIRNLPAGEKPQFASA